MAERKGRMADWIQSLKGHGGHALADSLATNYLEDLERLYSSGLPVYDRLNMPYGELPKRTREIRAFLGKHRRVLVRALPDDERKLRRERKFEDSMDGCLAFLESFIGKGAEGHYHIFLTEQRPVCRSGIIISDGESPMIELVEGDLSPLTDGNATPLLSGRFRYPHEGSRQKRMCFDIPGQEKDRRLAWKVLQYLRTAKERGSGLFSGISFREGYYEFDVGKNENTFFTDFKTKPGYLTLPS